MRLPDKKMFTLTPLEDVSILRKFEIFFLISSIMPMALLLLCLFQEHTTGDCGHGLYGDGCLDRVFVHPFITHQDD